MHWLLKHFNCSPSEFWNTKLIISSQFYTHHLSVCLFNFIPIKAFNIGQRKFNKNKLKQWIKNELEYFSISLKINSRFAIQTSTNRIFKHT